MVRPQNGGKRDERREKKEDGGKAKNGDAGMVRTQGW